ncbi:MAG: glycoside hydrolase family 25 protein [Clostridia bacterium]|nr:glycoside hydrolase family 25 protein [Clostridia bacterium]
MQRKSAFIKFITALLTGVILCQTAGCKGFFDSNGPSWDYNSEINKAAARNHKPFTGAISSDPEYDLPEMTEPFKVIDISAWQEKVDFKAVAESGVDGVILRLARYDMDKDTYFDRNYSEAKKNGLMVGCYYFMGAQSTDEAYSDAEKVTKLLDEKKYELELPVFYDVEDEHGSLSGNISSLDRQLLTDIIKTFCETMRENGYYTGYYSTVSFAEKEYYPEQLCQYPFWVARWSESVSAQLTYYVWQYSATGSVPGVNGECDINLCFADFCTYIEKHGYNNLSK